MGKVDLALKYFDKDHNCCQSILCTYAPQFGITYEHAYKIASGFGGGMTRLGNTCGSVTGAIMVLGLYKRTLNRSDTQNRDETYDLVRLFTDKFTEKNESLICRDLIGIDISTPEGLEEVRESGIVEKICINLVKSSAEILDDLL